MRNESAILESQFGNGRVALGTASGARGLYLKEGSVIASGPKRRPFRESGDLEENEVRGFMRLAWLGVFTLLLMPAAAWAQYPSELVGFNGPPIDDPATSQEMFQTPEFSSTTSGCIIPNDPGLYDNNAAFRAAGMQTEGVAALEVFFRWVDPTDPDCWVRLTTFNGPERPNPSLHTLGKVRFKITNRSEYTQGAIGICLGIRETGVEVPQMADGGTVGDIEWVGVIGVIPDPNDPNGFPLAPIPAITLAPSPVPYSLEWDLSTGVVSINGTPHGGEIMGFTGDGILNAPNDRGTLEHIAFTNVATDAAVLIDVGIDELQFEAPIPDPVLPPTVVWPIIAGDTEVTVTDLMLTVDQVALYVNGEPLQTQDVSTPDDVVFTIEPAITGDVYTATQHDSVTGIWSDHSDPVTVLPEASPYSFSIVLDEDGDDCGYESPGGWEFIPVTEVGSGPVPQGLFLFNNDGVWQTIDIPLDDPAVVLPWLGGNGQVDPSPTGLYSIDSLWFVIPAGAETPGPHELFIDAVEALDEFGEVIETLHHMESGINYLQNTRGQSSTQPTTTELTTAASYDGTTSHHLVWTYPSTAPDETLGLYHNIGWTCGTSPTFLDSAVTVRFHLLCRSQSDNPVPLPAVVAPIIVGNQDTVRVLNDEAATLVQLYLNGEPEGSPVTPTGTETDFSGLTLTPGDSVSATQTLPAGESDLAYPRGVNAVPLPPMISTPLLPGAETVTLTNVLAAPFATASEVDVYVNGAPAGSAPGGSQTIEVPTVELQPADLVTATQTVNDVTSAQSDESLVADTTVLREYEFAPTLAELSRSISATDLINGQIGLLENGDVDPANGVEAWNMNSSSACLEMAYTQPSPGFHPATPGGTEGGLADLTDGVEGTAVEAVLADFYRAALVVRYDFELPMSIREIVVFAANEDPGAPNNGRLYQHYDVWISTDNMQTFEPLALGVTTAGFGLLNLDDLRATFTRVYDGLSPVVAQDVTNIRFVFYCVSNTAGRFQDPWQGNFNEDAAYQSTCPDTEPEDTDGFRKAFEAPILKEIDVFALLPGDLDGDGDVDLSDLAILLSNYGQTSGANYEDGDLDFDGDVDLTDLAGLLARYGQGT
jgi:hypothetical protein